MTGPDQDAVLTANRAFYAAFGARDFAAMEALWAREAPVACIHPGWDALAGRRAVMASWRELLAQPGGPAIRCEAEQVMLHGDTAWVICHERLPGGVLVATNLFVREAGGWRLAHHQAGGIARPAASPESPPAGGRLH